MPVNRKSVQVLSATGTNMNVTSDKIRGDNYYGYTDGFHTLQVTYSSYVGRLRIQASLVLEPTDSDWFTVHEFTETSATKSVYANFTGNYTYIRAKLSYTAGSITSVLLNH